MKKLCSLLLFLSIISCTVSETAQHKIGMPNPASKYCVENGGKLIIKKDEKGNSYGICKLRTGEEIEEWEYFRTNN